METYTLGRESFWKRSPVGCCFSKFLFRQFSGTVADYAWNCVLRRSSWRLDRAPRMWLSVLLNSWYICFITLLFISSNTPVIYPSVILETAEFRDLLFLGDSSWLSLATAANFFLSLRLPFWRNISGRLLKIELVLLNIVNLENKIQQVWQKVVIQNWLMTNSIV